jgi:hypothetical protein
VLAEEALFSAGFGKISRSRCAAPFPLRIQISVPLSIFWNMKVLVCPHKFHNFHRFILDLLATSTCAYSAGSWPRRRA